MGLLVPRAAAPDRAGWPGRRWLAAVDVRPVVLAVLVSWALARVREAEWRNHRYHFTAWAVRRLGGVLLLVAVLCRLGMG